MYDWQALWSVGEGIAVDLLVFFFTLATVEVVIAVVRLALSADDVERVDE